METLEKVGEIVEAPPASDPQDTTIKTEPAPRAPEIVPEIARIPFADHERVVDGFHKRLDEVSWAKGYKREEVEEALALRRQLQERSKGSDEPQPNVKDENGEWFYDKAQGEKHAIWKAEKMVAAKMREIEDRIGPMESRFKKSEQFEVLSGQIHDATDNWPGFTDHIEPITALIQTAKSRGEEWAFEPWALREAYIQIVPRKLSETNTAREAELKKKWLAELNDTNAVVKDELNPARQASGSRKKESDMTDAELWEHVSAKAKSA